MSIRLRIWFLQGGFIVALAAFSVLLHWAFLSYENRVSENRAALTAVAEAQATLSALKDAEMTQRAFLITGERQSLDAYEAARQDLQSGILELRALANAEARPVYEADTLSMIASSRLVRLEEGIRQRKLHRLTPAGLQIAVDVNDADATQTHAAIDNIISTQQSRVIETREQLDAGSSRVLEVIRLGIATVVLIAIFLVIVTYGFVSRPLRALAVGLDSISRNESPGAIAIPGGDELSLVAEAFNRLADDLRRAEKTRHETEGELSRSNDQLIARNAEVTARTRSIDLLGRMAYRLPGCTNTGEFAALVERFAPQLFPGIPGALYILSGSHTMLNDMAQWGNPKGALPEFGPQDCWGLRRGQAHEIENVSVDVVCNHVRRESVLGYRCIPLVAQSETVGLLYLERTDETVPWAIEEHDLRVLAETLALALVNLKLRESLHEQSIRDPLTGLFNRRYLTEALELEEARADRKETSIAAIMIDIDHFKRFNDEFGHDAGDAVLRCLADTMTHHVRAGDVICRFGGEEFIIVQPGGTLDRASACAEELRQAVEALALMHHGKSLGRVTISLGVAVLPDCASTTKDLLEAADHALYAAKHAGRNRVETAARTMITQQTALAS